MNGLPQRLVLGVSLLLILSGRLCAQTAPSLTSITPPYVAAGISVPVTLTGAGFGAALTVSVGTSGITVSDVNVVSSTSATATISVPAGTPALMTTVSAANSVGASNSLSFFVFPAIPSINPGSLVSGSLVTTSGIDPFSIHGGFPTSGPLADLYQLTLSTATAVTIDMQSATLYPALYLASSSGSMLSGGKANGGYAEISAALSAGTYYIVAGTSFNSSATGAYTISINLFPTLIAITPPFAGGGTSTLVTLIGSGFAAPMTAAAGSGTFSDLTFNNVNILDSTSATAILNVPAGTPGGTAIVTVTTSAGSSYPASFIVFSSIPPIAPGDILTGSLGTNDPFLSTSYADLYQLTLNSTQTITIDMRSTAFSNPWVLLMSSSGASLAFGVNNTGDSQLTTTLQAGMYYITATSVNSPSTGTYTLSVAEKKVRAQITSQ